MYKIYKVIRDIGRVIRPIFFEYLIEDISIIDNLLYDWIIAIVLSEVLHYITFKIVGLFYKRRTDHAALGSGLYTILYFLYTFFAWLILQCFKVIIIQSILIDVLMYICIGLILTINIGALILIKRRTTLF